MCSGVIFVGLVVVAHKAQSEEDFFARDLDILTIQPIFSGTELMPPNLIKTDSVFSHSDNIAPVESGVSNTLRLGLVAETKAKTAWSANAQWQIAPGSNRASLSPILRFESKDGQIDIKPRRHSIWVVWRKSFY
jgi:hypothetical protein